MLIITCIYYKVMTVIGFYGKHCLSNFSDHAIMTDSQHYPTVEHYFQTMKFILVDNGVNDDNSIKHTRDNITNGEIARRIHSAATPDEAQKLAKQYK